MSASATAAPERSETSRSADEPPMMTPTRRSPCRLLIEQPPSTGAQEPPSQNDRIIADPERSPRIAAGLHEPSIVRARASQKLNQCLGVSSAKSALRLASGRSSRKPRL